MECEQAKIKQIRAMFKSLVIEFPVPLDEYGRKKKPPVWHAWNLIPQTDTWGVKADGYDAKMMCWKIAQGEYTTYKLLYEQTTESDIWEAWGMMLADMYHAPD